MSTTRREPPADASLLGRIALFEGLEASALEGVALAARTRRAHTGAHFFRQGEAAAVLYVVAEGQVKLSQYTPEGHQVVLHVAGPGEAFGAVAALGDAHYPLSAQAASECRVLMWPGPDMVDLMERYPRLAMNALRVVTRRMQELQDRYRELATERVERRVARALLRLARQAGRKVEGGVLIDLNVNRQDLAEMTGTTRYTVSRMLSEWEAHGLLDAGRERVLIKRPHGLVVIAEDLPEHISPTNPLE